MQLFKVGSPQNNNKNNPKAFNFHKKIFQKGRGQKINFKRIGRKINSFRKFYLKIQNKIYRVASYFNRIHIKTTDYFYFANMNLLLKCKFTCWN